MAKIKGVKENRKERQSKMDDCMKKAKGNSSKVRSCKIKFAAQTGTSRQHGWKPKG